MKILVLGSGLMGPAVAFNVASDPEVMEVLLVDQSQAALDGAAQWLAALPGGEKLAARRLDLADRAATAELAALMGRFDTVVAALPPQVALQALAAALKADVPLVDLARPDYEQMPELQRVVHASDGLVVMGCGVEPGLTEIMARHLAEELDWVEAVHIKCGGVPENPTPPLGYKLVFGGQELPLTEDDALVVQDGQLKLVPRYSGVERVIFSGVGECEAWHEGFVPWLTELPALAGLREGTQKTLRWPGYAAKVTVLRELGLLSTRPVTVDGSAVAPKQLLDAVLAPRLRLEEDERDITLLRVDVEGEKEGQRVAYRVEMVDRDDEELGLTSMARTTGFTAGILVRMIARGEIVARGLFTPERLIVGPLFDRLVDELAGAGIYFDRTVSETALLRKKVEQDE
jgi:lysine 6-dehydrogenase